MFKQIDKLLPAGATHAGLSRIGSSMWLVALPAILFAACLIIDGLLVFRKRRARMERVQQIEHARGASFSLFRKFIRWLLYPSFPNVLGDE